VQALTSSDYGARVVFCQWLLGKFVVNTQFVANIPFTDEAGFTREGIVNSYNTHIWADDNPRTTVAPRDQHQQHLNHTFDEQRIGRGGTVNWPARLPDLLTLWIFGCGNS
jgi:hypothetical protein